MASKGPVPRKKIILLGAIAAVVGAGAVAAALIRQAAGATALIGQVAPDFTLPDQNGKPHALHDSRGKWVVLAFYPADKSAGCTLQNHSYTVHAGEFAALNAVVYTVSTQDTASKQAFCAEQHFSHMLLSDVGGATAKAYGALMPIGGVAQRYTFYIAPDGKVAFVDTRVNPLNAAGDSLAILRGH